MATKSNKTQMTIIDTAAATMLGVATKANDFALSTTEKVFTTSFTVAGKCIGMSSKVVKRGLQITDTQQDLFFDVLEGIKRKIVKK